jgi:hypothetical protein
LIFLPVLGASMLSGESAAILWFILPISLLALTSGCWRIDRRPHFDRWAFSQLQPVPRCSLRGVTIPRITFALGHQRILKRGLGISASPLRAEMPGAGP